MTKIMYRCLNFYLFLTFLKTFSVTLTPQLFASSNINFQVVQAAYISRKLDTAVTHSSTKHVHTHKHLRKTDKPFFANSNVKLLTSIAEFIRDVLCIAEEDSSLKSVHSFPVEEQKCNNNVRLVMFFAHWCGACHRYAPTWSKLSDDFKDVKNIIYFAFDCAENTLHQNLCTVAQIEGYPTLIAFSSFEKGLSVNKSFTLSTKLNEKLSHFVSFKIPLKLSSYSRFIDWIESQFKIDTALATKLNGEEKLNIDSLVPIARKMPGMPRWEDEYSYFSSSRLFHKHINSDSSLKKGFRSSNISSNSSNKFLMSENTPDLHLHDGLLALIFILRNWLSLKGVKSGKILESNKVQNEKDNESSTTAYYLDSNYAKSVCTILDLIYRILSAKNMKEEIKSMYDFLNCYKSNTSSSFRINLNSLNSFMDNWSIGNVKTFKLGVFPPYKTCKTFLCGVWLLFHFLFISMSVQADKLLTNKSLDKHRLDLPTPYELLLGFRDIVFNFFSCTECRLHFNDMYNSCAYDRCNLIPNIDAYSSMSQNYIMPLDVSMSNILHNDKDKQQKYNSNQIKVTQNEAVIEFSNHYEAAVFWLWKVHNVVTLRTAADETLELFKGLSTALYERIKKKNAEKNKSVAFDVKAYTDFSKDIQNSSLISDEDIKNIFDYLKMIHKSYLDVDVRWPSKISCPQCRFEHVKPIIINEEILKKVLRRNEINNSLDDKENVDNKEEFQDTNMWNLMGDFKWKYTYEFLKKLYFKHEWTDTNINLYFCKKSESFIIKD